MQRTRDWRRKQYWRHIFKWPYTKFNLSPYWRAKYVVIRNDERLDGWQEVDYNREKFKQETHKEIEIQLDNVA